MIYLKEVLPNPVGRDNDGEWVRLFNDGSEEANLTGWSLKDESGKSFLLTGKSVKSQSELELKYAETKLSLNNDGDTLVLYDSQNKEADKLEYKSVVEGETVTAPRFETTIRESAGSEKILGQISSSQVLNGSYEWWPLLVGLGLAVLAVLVGAAFYKVVRNNS